MKWRRWVAWCWLLTLCLLVLALLAAALWAWGWTAGGWLTGLGVFVAVQVAPDVLDYPRSRDGGEIMIGGVLGTVAGIAVSHGQLGRVIVFGAIALGAAALATCWAAYILWGQPEGEGK